MATFDFDHAPERLGTRCVKWDSIGEGELPMWVADMDFEVAPAIRQAVERLGSLPYGVRILFAATAHEDHSHLVLRLDILWLVEAS